jgi:hypothetical protein
MIEQKTFRPITVFSVLGGNISAQYTDFVYYAENFLHNNLIYGIIYKSLFSVKARFRRKNNLSLKSPLEKDRF